MDGMIEKSGMSADALKLPDIAQPYAWRQDGMRIVAMYQINSDDIIARFDTKINGEQYNCGFSASMTILEHEKTTPIEFAKMVAPLALDAFLKGKAQKGYQLFILDSR